MKEAMKPKERLEEEGKLPEKFTRERKLRDRNVPAGRMTLTRETARNKRGYPAGK